MDDQFKQKTAEYNENKEKINAMIPSKEADHAKEVKRLHGIHVLANEKVRLNDTIGDNSGLKVKINVMRKEIE